jgi:DNA-binding GntR family transcriptional regulator
MTSHNSENFPQPQPTETFLLFDSAPTIVKHVDLNQQVYDVLVNWLVTRKLRPRQKLSISAIAEELSVSRSPVHQALTRMASENLIKVSPRRGYYIQPITPEVVLHAFDVRLALELMAAERTVGKISDLELIQFRHVMEATLPNISSDQIINKQGYITTNVAFHRYQIALARNELMLHYYQNLNVNLFMGRTIYTRNTGMGHVAAENIELVEAFEAGDLARVQNAIRTHIESGKRVAVEEINASGGEL